MPDSEDSGPSCAELPDWLEPLTAHLAEVDRKVPPPEFTRDHQPTLGEIRNWTRGLVALAPRSLGDSPRLKSLSTFFGQLEALRRRIHRSCMNFGQQAHRLRVVDDDATYAKRFESTWRDFWVAIECARPSSVISIPLMGTMHQEFEKPLYYDPGWLDAAESSLVHGFKVKRDPSVDYFRALSTGTPTIEAIEEVAATWNERTHERVASALRDLVKSVAVAVIGPMDRVCSESSGLATHELARALTPKMQILFRSFLPGQSGTAAEIARAANLDNNADLRGQLSQLFKLGILEKRQTGYFRPYWTAGLEDAPGT